MKILWIALATVFLVACNTQREKETTQADEISVPAAAEWVEVTLQVEGMTCEGCENAIKAGVEKLAGIDSVESSHEEAWTRVKYDSQRTSLEEITASITNTGYEVKGEL